MSRSIKNNYCGNLFTACEHYVFMSSGLQSEINAKLTVVKNYVLMVSAYK